MKLRLYPVFVVIIALCILSIKAFGQVKTRTNRPAKEPYASMSSSDQQKVREKLVAKLKVDTDFIAIEKITDGIIDETIKRRAKGIKSSPMDKNSNTPEAKKMREDMLNIMIKNLSLIKKYPQLEQLDSEARNAVFKEARKGSN